MGEKKTEEKDKKVKGGDQKSEAQNRAPEWAAGLRQLYDSVVDEPLPDTFKDLISKLDRDEA